MKYLILALRLLIEGKFNKDMSWRKIIEEENKNRKERIATMEAVTGVSLVSLRETLNNSPRRKAKQERKNKKS